MSLGGVGGADGVGGAVGAGGAGGVPEPSVEECREEVVEALALGGRGWIDDGRGWESGEGALLEMDLESDLLSVGLAAGWADVWLDAGVYAFVYLHVALVGECLGAEAALEGPLAGVESSVNVEGRGVGESLPAVLAQKLSLLRALLRFRRRLKTTPNQAVFLRRPGKWIQGSPPLIPRTRKTSLRRGIELRMKLELEVVGDGERLPPERRRVDGQLATGIERVTVDVVDLTKV